MNDDAVHPAVEACATRTPSPLTIVLGLVLIGHAVMALAGVVETAPWVPVVECIAACAIGLSHLRRIAEQPSAPEETPAGFGAPIVPARVGAPADPVERVART
jgi:hypothetical protein